MTARSIVADEHSWKSQFPKTVEPDVSPINTQPNIYTPFVLKQTDDEGTNLDKGRLEAKDVNSNNVCALVETCAEAVDNIRVPHRNIGGLSPRNLDSYDHLTHMDHPEEHQRLTCSIMCDMLKACLSNLSKKIRNSKYFLAVPIILLAMPLSACYMGIKYYNGCPGKSVLPFLVLIIGILGVLVLVCHIVFLSKRHFPNMRRIELKEIRTRDVFFLTLVFLLLEICGFYFMSPDFNQESPDYCAKALYSYTYNMNFVALAVCVLAMLLHMPAIRTDPSATSNYETV